MLILHIYRIITLYLLLDLKISASDKLLNDPIPPSSSIKISSILSSLPFARAAFPGNLHIYIAI